MEFIDGHSFDGFSRPEIDGLTIIEATEIMANYCLESPEQVNDAFVSRMVVEGLFVAVALTHDCQADSDFDEWIYRMRLTTDEFPQNAFTGIEVRLPHGVGATTWQGINYSYEIPGSNSGVFISYQNNRDFWHSMELMNGSPVRPFDYWSDEPTHRYASFIINQDTVSDVDRSIEKTTRNLQRVDIGFNLSIALGFLDREYLEVADTSSQKIAKFNRRNGFIPGAE
jgi:hypothetical protein